MHIFPCSLPRIVTGYKRLIVSQFVFFKVPKVPNRRLNELDRIGHAPAPKLGEEQAEGERKKWSPAFTPGNKRVTRRALHYTTETTVCSEIPGGFRQVTGFLMSFFSILSMCGFHGPGLKKKIHTFSGVCTLGPGACSDERSHSIPLRRTLWVHGAHWA